MHPTPHDAFVKAMLADLRRAEELIRHSLGVEAASFLDFATLAPEPGSFVDDALRERHVDRLFSVQLLGQPARVYVLYEHKSAPERWLGLAVLAYEVQIWQTLLKAEPTRDKLPPIFSIVIFHGEKGLRVGTHFQALVDLPADAPASLRELVPEFRFALTDLSPAASAVVVPGALRASTELMLSALQLARSDRDLAEMVRGWRRLVREVWLEPDGAAAVDLVFRYIAEVRDLRDRDIIEVIAREVGRKEADTMQSLVEMWRQEGARKGREEGREEGRKEGQRALLLRLLRRRFGRLPRRVLAAIEAADARALERWSDALLDARTLAELFPLT